MPDNKPLELLFVCRHNSVRSQIAEILANKLGGNKVQAISAGPEPMEVPGYINHWAQQVSGEDKALTSRSLDSQSDRHFDMIITLCDKSHSALPELPSDQTHIRWDFHHADSLDELKHLEIEIAERLRLMFMTKGII
ncbi:MAG: hypothetical protein OQK12_04500 [Motiliproteus sp.]|nr:hypothetical protein [Motiliproteus sp.]MCW9051474.1 hypothetical protein [Motiliproteus sp.]